MGLSYKNTYYQDATPTPERIGDEWITANGRVRICYQVTPTALWADLSRGNQNLVSPGFFSSIGVYGPHTVARAAMTDGGSTAGTLVLPGALPVGAVVLRTTCTVETAFIGDTSAVIIVGDGSDTDRYMTGTPSVFTTSTNLAMGIVSGLPYIVTANSPTVTITSNADFTNVSAGSLTLRFLYAMVE